MAQRGTKVLRQCLYCGVDFFVSRGQFKAYKGAGKFCSRPHHYDFYRENPTEHPLYKPGWYLETHSGYLARGMRKSDKSTAVVRQHRYIMEEHLGRELKTTEHVHHINHNRLDNRLENLQVMSDSEHHKVHSSSPEDKERLREAQKLAVIARRTNLAGRWCRDHTECLSCQGTSYKHQAKGLCSRCYLNNYRKLN